MNDDTSEKAPVNSEFEGANRHPGDVFGDKSPRTPPSAGASLPKGLAFSEVFHDESPDSLGEGRDDANGKPMGPEKGAVDNGGASAKLIWG